MDRIQRAMTLPMLSGGWLRIRAGTFRFRDLQVNGPNPGVEWTRCAALATDARR
jgi:hypothetical protein